MTDKSMLLEIKDLSIEGRREDGWLNIVSGIDLHLHRGEILGLIGESGAGKSTLGLAAMGYTRDGCRIAGGSIVFDGMDLTRMSEKEKCALRGNRIAYVAQSAAASFNPAHRLIDQCTEGPLVHRVPRSQLLESASGDSKDIPASRRDAEQFSVDLYGKLFLPNPESIGRRYPHQLSGGQLQRVMTAMAMASRPDLIIFDEPTTALDVTTQIEVLAAIRDVVREQKVAAIYITHDLAVVAQMADRIKVLLKGEEIEEADTPTMLSQPREDYTKSLWAVRSFHKAEQIAPPTEETPVLEARGITAFYGKHRVLSSVGFKVHRKRTVAIVGESGSGKTTAAKVITGLFPPQSGEIILNGVVLPSDYRKRSKDQLRQVRMIYQAADTALNPKQKIIDIVGRPAAFYLGLNKKQMIDRVKDLLNMIELEPSLYMNCYPGELSGGQKQRIGIARALAAEPQFIICDEVTSALDQIVAEGILKLLDRLQTNLGLSYMFITHDLATVKAIADEVVVMKEGEIVDQGEKDVMFRPPHHPYADLLLSSVPEMDPNWLDNLLEKRREQPIQTN